MTEHSAEKGLLDNYDPVPSLVARGVMSDEHDPDSCEFDCCATLPGASLSGCVECGREIDRTIPNPIPEGYECMWSEAMSGQALYCRSCYGDTAPTSPEGSSGS